MYLEIIMKKKQIHQTKARKKLFKKLIFKFLKKLIDRDKDKKNNTSPENPLWQNEKKK
jgi:hypothetical protein